MILKLSKRTMIGRHGTDDPVMDDLFSYWNCKREGRETPNAEALFISGVNLELPWIVLVFRDVSGFRGEFAGSEAQDMIGFDPSGEVLNERDENRVLAGLASSCAGVSSSRDPDLLLTHGWSAISLPFTDDRDRVTVILCAVVPFVVTEKSTVVPFPPTGRHKRTL